MWKELGDVLRSLLKPEFRRFACGVALLVGGLGLFAPQWWFTSLRLAPIADDKRTILAAVVLVGVFGFAYDLLSWLGLRVKWLVNKRRYVAKLRNLTTEEKQLLCGYILAKQKTQYFPIQDGVVMGLVSDKIIFQSSTLGFMTTGFAFNIQPWAWDYLRKHPELIVDESLPTDDDGKIIPYHSNVF